MLFRSNLSIKTGGVKIHGRFTLAKRFHGAPTNRSQRVTLETDAPEILARCRQDQVDAALLVPT